MIKKPIKLPRVLATLGRIVEIKGEHVHYYFSAKKQMRLISDALGRTLFGIQVAKKKTSSLEFLEFWKRYQSQADKAVDLYEKWNDFDAQTGSIIRAPRGFFFRVDRCVSIIYESEKWGGKRKKYIHDFSTPPLIYVNKKTEPTVIKLSGGKIRVTKRGITG